MLLYHGSAVTGLTTLTPRQSNHERPYVYLTDSATLALLYAHNPIARPGGFFPTGSIRPDNCTTTSISPTRLASSTKAGKAGSTAQPIAVCRTWIVCPGYTCPQLPFNSWGQIIFPICTELSWPPKRWAASASTGMGTSRRSSRNATGRSSDAHSMARPWTITSAFFASTCRSFSESKQPEDALSPGSSHSGTSSASSSGTPISASVLASRP